MPKAGVNRPRKQWVFSPQSGGRPISAQTQTIVRQRILDYAQTHYAGKFIRIDVRFHGALCYIDAYQEPDPEGRRWAETHGESPAEYDQRIRNTPVHLVRLRHFDLERWTLAFYTYSNERYEPCIYPHGDWNGTVEQAFDVGAEYLR